jgi:hypothetical protein
MLTTDVQFELEQLVKLKNEIESIAVRDLADHAISRIKSLCIQNGVQKQSASRNSSLSMFLPASRYKNEPKVPPKASSKASLQTPQVPPQNVPEVPSKALIEAEMHRNDSIFLDVFLEMAELKKKIEAVVKSQKKAATVP